MSTDIEEHARALCNRTVSVHIYLFSMVTLTAIQPPVFNGLSNINQEDKFKGKFGSRNHKAIKGRWAIFKDEEICYQKSCFSFKCKVIIARRESEPTKIAAVPEETT